jgi:hypothetical protein
MLLANFNHAADWILSTGIGSAYAKKPGAHNQTNPCQIIKGFPLSQFPKNRIK